MSERSSPNVSDSHCPWVMRVGVFFDGTGNNKENDKSVVNNAGEVIQGSSMSNIAKLSEIYQTGQDNEELTIRDMVYKNGVGTINGKEDEGSGLAKGEGGIERVHEAIKQVADFFDKKPCAKEFIVDVFGFSRGAAQARHFVNELHDRAAGPNVKVGFIGLFDTVASFALSWSGVLGFSEDQAGDNINQYQVMEYQGVRRQVVNPLDGMEVEAPYYKNIIKDFNFHLSAASADYIEHFIARDEIRENFPLSSLEPNDGGFINEKSFIGVHSDIGGGYSNEAEDSGISNLLVKIKTTRRTRYSIEEIEHYTASEIDNIRRLYEQKGYKVSEKQRRGSTWLYGTKTVSNDLAKVYMQLMHMKAMISGVPLKDLPNNDDHNIPEDLTDYALSVLNNHAFPKENEQYIYRNYVHQSHIDSEDRGFFALSELAHAPEESGNRTIFANDSSLAIVPEENDNPNAGGPEISTDNLASRG